MGIFLRVGAACCALLALVLTGRCADDVTPLLCRLPESANTVVVINLKTIRELTGRSEGYQIVAGAVVPPGVDLIVYATHLEPGALSTRKTIGLVQLSREATLDDVMDKKGGQIIDLGGEKAVTHPTKGYFVMLTPTLVGIGRNASRQELLRGMQFARTSTTCQLSAFLMGSITAASAAPIAAALDTENMLEMAAVRERLGLVKVLEGHSKQEVQEIADIVSGMKGIALTVGGRDLNQGEFRLEFSKAIGAHGPLLKSVLLEALNDLGASMYDLEKAQVTTEGRTLKLTNKLSDEGLIQIMSLFMPPAPEPKAASTPKMESNGVSIDVTRRFYQSVDSMLDDLRKKTKKATDNEKAATWHETYANRIEHLPTRYVDSDMVKFAFTVAMKLRTISYSLRGVVVEVNSLEGGLTMAGVATGGSLFGSGAVQIDSNIAQIRSKQAEIVRQDASRRFKIWETIDTDERTVLKTMHERYGQRFEKR